MTNLPEAKLAREAEICYSTIALSTDYDCWHETEADVTVEAVMAIIRQNVSLAKQIVKGSVERIPEARSCGCTLGGGERGHDGARRDPAGGARTARHHHEQILGAEMSERAVQP